MKQAFSLICRLSLVVMLSVLYREHYLLLYELITSSLETLFVCHINLQLSSSRSHCEKTSFSSFAAQMWCLNTQLFCESWLKTKQHSFMNFPQTQLSVLWRHNGRNYLRASREFSLNNKGNYGGNRKGDNALYNKDNNSKLRFNISLQFRITFIS